MANTTDYDVPDTTSLSAMLALEDAIRSLRLTRAEGQNFVRAFVNMVDRSTGSPRPSTLPAIVGRATSPISANYDILSSSGEDLNDVLNEDDGAGDIPSVVLHHCPTCVSHSIAVATPVNIAAATRVPASAPIAATTPVVTPSSTAAPAASGITPTTATLTSNTTATAVSTGVASSAASTIAAVVTPPAAIPAPTPGPMYAHLPPNAPSNAVLPPSHLVHAIYGYHTPGNNVNGPFYVITRGRNIGIFSGWETLSPLVTGVSHAVYSRVASVAEGHARMISARTSAFALYLT